MGIVNPKYFICGILYLGSCLLCYFLGRSHAEIKIVKEQGEEIIREIEVIKYVEKQKSEIWAAPNATSTELLGLMQDNKL